jgi:ABC-type transport system substrate-binding protein
MKLSHLRLVAASSLLLMAAAAQGGSRPRYGGAVRVLLHDRITSLDPLVDDDHPASRDRITSLLFETLTELDPQGHARARLSNSWRADPGKRSWQFRLRFANFQDGSQLTAADVVASLSRINPNWKWSAPDRQTVNIETPALVNHLPELLALQKYAIVKKTPENTLIGTGPYRVNEWVPGERVLLSASDDYWGGRSFPDLIEFFMGATLRDQLAERHLGQMSAAELTLDQVRTVESANQNVVTSRPSDLLVVVFLQPDIAASSSQPAKKAVDARVREVLSAAINRAAINNLLLQKRGSPASGMLPQWLTGYEFLFPGNFDLEHAKQLRSETAGLIIIPRISLAYDFSDPMAKLVAERVALDAREAGLIIQPYAESHVNNRSARAAMNADAVLLRVPLASLDPSVALASMMEDLAVGDRDAALGASRPEDLFEIESKAMGNFRVVPVVHIPENLWLNVGIHNWQQMPNGAWALDRLWTEGLR